MRPLRRSFVHRRLVAAGAQLVPFRDALAAGGYGDPDAEREALGRLALVDLSLLPRAGFKGRARRSGSKQRACLCPATNHARRAAGDARGSPRHRARCWC